MLIILVAGIVRMHEIPLSSRTSIMLSTMQFIAERLAPSRPVRCVGLSSTAFEILLI